MISKEQIKRIRALHKKKFRDQRKLFIIEGTKMIQEALKHNPGCIQSIYSTDDSFSDFNYSGEHIIVDQKQLNQISTLQHPQKQVAICKYQTPSHDSTEFILALDTIQDPGNLGTILRLAAWFGIEKIIASKETVDVYNPKVVQASMGAVFTVSVKYINLKEELQQTNLPIYGAVLNGDSIYQKQVDKKGILLMGNEGNGISDDLLSLIEHPVSIPQFGKGESLNVAMATSILVSEFCRNFENK